MSASPTRVFAHRARNVLHTAALLGLLALWSAGLGALAFGEHGALWGLVGGGVAAVASLWTAPGMVLRLYGARRLRPEQAPGLFRAVAVLARRAGLPMPEVHYIASPVPNAIAVGSRRRPGIAVTDGLVRTLPDREVVAVLAHEMSHVASGDLVVMALADGMSRFVGFLGQIGIAVLLFGLCFAQPGVLPTAFLLATGPTLATLLQLALSRTREHEADLGAVRLTGDPRGLASALRRIEQPMRVLEQLFGLPGRDLSPSLMRTHPLTEERVRRLESLEVRDEPPPPVEPWVDLPRVERLPRRAWWGGRW